MEEDDAVADEPEEDSQQPEESQQDVVGEDLGGGVEPTEEEIPATQASPGPSALVMIEDSPAMATTEEDTPTPLPQDSQTPWSSPEPEALEDVKKELFPGDDMPPPPVPAKIMDKQAEIKKLQEELKRLTKH